MPFKMLRPIRVVGQAHADSDTILLIVYTDVEWNRALEFIQKFSDMPVRWVLVKRYFLRFSKLLKVLRQFNVSFIHVFNPDYRLKRRLFLASLFQFKNWLKRIVLCPISPLILEKEYQAILNDVKTR